MGGGSSTLEGDSFAELQESSNFTAKELKKLHKRFKKLDRDDTGKIKASDFLRIPELQMNPLVDRVIEIFDNGNEELAFEDFVRTLSVFSVKGEAQEKLKFAFRVYDLDGDGYISNGELFRILKMIVGRNLNDVQLQQVVDKTILDADVSGDGRISFEEFESIIEAGEARSKMTARC